MGHLIRSWQSTASDARLAVREFHAGVQQPEMAMVLFFCSSLYDLDALADEIKRCFGDVCVVGTTTAGEIGPRGYCTHSLSGASFPAASFTAVSGLIGDLQQFDPFRGHVLIQSLLQRLETAAPDAGSANSFAFLMIDGLSCREEYVSRIFQNELGRLPLVGGSSSDDFKLKQTYVFHDGVFHPHSAALLLMSTRHPFSAFMTQHFVRGGQRLVVTAADPARRLVTEINGRPAAEEYARAIGIPFSSLGAFPFANSPVVVVIEGRDYVRSIQKANPDGSLTFFCAIDEGIVLRIAHGVDLAKNLRDTFENLQHDIGPLQVVLTSDCTLRNVEITENGLKDTVGKIMVDNKAIGFSTYGEQFCGIHVNQTLTGIAIGTRSADE
jgi:hypothetical protein